MKEKAVLMAILNIALKKRYLLIKNVEAITRNLAIQRLPINSKDNLN